MILIKKGLNFLPSLKPLYELHKRCLKVDNFALKLYWHILETRCHDNKNQLDYLAYVNNQLVGALQLYFFADSTEITAMVAPSHRRKGIFKKMLSKAVGYLRSHHVLQCILICNEKNTSLNHQLKNWGGRLKHSVSEWQAPSYPSILQSDPLITIEQVQIKDIETIVEINYLCFPLSIKNNLQPRFINDLQSSNRQIYFAKNQEQQVIGKLHVREEPEQVVIHEVGIIPTVQGKGFGRILMINWLRHYAKQYNEKPIIVEVLNYNKAAIALYLSCGFTKQNNYNYYELAITDLWQVIK